MAGRLDGKVALVTGAGSGIGAASARALAKEGAAVAVTDIRADAAKTVASEIGDAGGHARGFELDVADESAWRQVVAAVRAEFGPVTVLHGNAALTSTDAYRRDLGVVDLDMSLFDSIVAVNLKGNVLGCKHVIPGMIEAGGGSIVLTSSVKALTGSAHRTAYSVSKGGVDTLAMVVATGYGKVGVRCNAVAPGIVVTTATSVISQAQREALLEAHLTPELGAPEDIAAAVVFLASDEARFVTGQVVCVDGGLAAHTAVLSPGGSRVRPASA